MRKILHIDMDAFYASVEQRDDPTLRGRPVVVAWRGMRSVVCAASYEARRYGVRSAMPMFKALELCPDATVIPPDMAKYVRVGREVRQAMQALTPLVEPLSIDEAFLDVRGARRLFGEPVEIADLLRRRIREELALPSSVGGSVSRAVAKIASARAKPDGMLIVPADRTAEFLAPLPVGAISGVGPKAQAALERLGVRTIGQLREVPTSTLARALGPRTPEILALADGSDRTGLGHRTKDRSLGTERTWDEDLTDPAEVRRRITMMADEVSRQLRRSGFVSRTVVLKLRAPDGTTLSRSSTFDQPTASGERLREHVVALWERERPTMRRVRLAGVRATQLEPAAGVSLQSELSARPAGWTDLEAAMDRARDRFGSASLSRGSTLEPGRAEAPSTESPAPGESSPGR